MNIEFDTKEKAVAHILGKIAGLNEVRTSVMSIGYDKDETALMIRRQCTDQIFELKEIVEIQFFGDAWFNDAKSFLDQLNKGDV